MSIGQRLRTAVLAAAIAGSPCLGHAGVFDDDIAREQNAKTQKELTEFRTKTDATLDRMLEALKMQIELSRQIDTLRAELNTLRGQVEVLTNTSDNAEKRQRDFYLDLDGRLRKVEATIVDLQTKAAEPAAPPAPKVDPAAETRIYEDALNLFKGANYGEAQTAFQNFQRDYPASPLASSAQFWLANAHYAQQDCKSAIDAHTVVVTKYASSLKAPDSMLAISTCQQELKDPKGARKTLDQLLVAYPQSPAAETARQRLKRK